jgi:DNA gyrase/topoisomerase IV subunit A
MPDDEDKRYLDDWRAAFAQLQQRGRRLTQLENEGVDKTDQAVVAVADDYTRLLAELEQLWKAYYAKRAQE